LGRMNLVLSHIKRISEPELAAITALADQWWSAELRES
jgi:deoxyribodipyrimidine photolyase-related protein